jgi:hypothetical protein
MLQMVNLKSRVGMIVLFPLQCYTQRENKWKNTILKTGYFFSSMESVKTLPFYCISQFVYDLNI